MDPTVRRMYLSIIEPSIEPKIGDNGGFIVNSVESYTLYDETIKPLSCSLIARKNL